MSARAARLEAPKQLFAGLIIDTATSLTSRVRATGSTSTPGHTYGPCTFLPNFTLDPDVVMIPAEGDPCLIGMDDEGNSWIIAWYGGTPLSISSSGVWVPYTGATANLDLGAFNLIATLIQAVSGLTIQGGQIFKIVPVAASPNTADFQFGDGTGWCVGFAPASGANAGKKVLRIYDNTGKLGWAIPSTGVEDTNLYRASADMLKTDDALTIALKLILGANSPVSSALISACLGGNDFEWGHANGAGYRSVLGANAGDGTPFVAFSSEAGATNNTFRTRGLPGSVITGDLAGGLRFNKVPTATADNQALVQTASLSAAGVLDVLGGFTAAGVAVRPCPVVSTLPTVGLVDGQEVYYQSAAMATDGIAWHLRYRSASASAYKWEYVGGSALRAVASGGASSTSATDALWSNGPLLTIPLTGVYEVNFGFVGMVDSSTTYEAVARAMLYRDTTSTTFWAGAKSGVGQPNDGAIYVPTSQRVLALTVTAAEVLRLYTSLQRPGGAVGTARYGSPSGWINARPINVG